MTKLKLKSIKGKYSKDKILKHSKTNVYKFALEIIEKINKYKPNAIRIENISKNVNFNKKEKNKIEIINLCNDEENEEEKNLIKNRIEENSENVFECPICYKIKNKNKIKKFKCSHEICEKCEIKIEKIQKKCPICRTKF